MFNKSGINAKQIIGLSNKRGFYRVPLLRAFADEGSNDSGSTPPQVNFEELIANARKEEKEKLYPRIKKLEDDNKALIQTNNDYIMRLAQTQKELESYKAKAESGDSEEVKDLKKKLEDANNEIATLKESTPKEEEIRAKIEAEYEVKFYRQNKLTEGADKILSVFVDEVQGKTKEEIDASFDKAVEKTLQTKKQLGLVDEDGNPIVKDKKDDKKDGKKDKVVPPIANPDTKEDEEFDFDYVQNLDPRSPEYAEFRKKMGLK